MRRRDLIAAGAAALAPAAPSCPALAQPAGARVLKFVPQANLASLDPVWTTANITRHHGFLVYDTLYGLDADFVARPQMAEGHLMENGGLTCTITLREGLRFHDGEPVHARDAVASLRRWMRRNTAGQYIEAATAELTALDDRRLRFRLTRPQPRLIDALATVTSPVAFIMPERIASTDAFAQIRETVGSGPFRFKADEYLSGSRMVYERNPDYRPTPDGGRGLTAGPKQVHFDRVEWHVLPDAGTAAAALQAGEVDWYENPPPELVDLLRRARAVSIENMDMLPQPGILRLNHLHPPFDNPAIRRALLAAVNQADFMAAVVGDDPANSVTDGGVFTPGTPMASREGLRPPVEARQARAMLRDAGYKGEPVRLIGPTDILAPTAIAQVGADLLRRVGFNLDLVLSDWGSVVQRRASREPLDKGGWSIFPTAVNAADFIDPSVHFALRGNGMAAWFGWPTSPRLEALRDAWFLAGPLGEQKRIAAEMQAVAMEEVPYLPVGSYRSRTALRRDLRDRVVGFSIFWGIRRG